MLSDSPPERDLQWTDTGIAASFKFINKLYDLVEKYKNYKETKLNDTSVKESLKEIVNQVSENIEAFQFNKSVAKIYEFVNIVNDCLTKKNISKIDLKWSLNKLSIILQPFVPHISEEIWYCLGNRTLCINEQWLDEDVKKKVSIKIAVQINGKTRAVIEIDKNVTKEKLFETIKSNDKIKKILLGRIIQREIFVPGKIVNLVIT